MSIEMPRSFIKIYAWGANSHGQTGTGIDSEELHLPTPVLISEDLANLLAPVSSRVQSRFTASTADGSTVVPPGGAGVAVTGGGGHSVMIVDGIVFTAGANWAGQLGRETDGAADGVFRRVSLDELVVSAACGWDHTLILTESGRVLAAGGNGFGQLGITTAAASAPATKASAPAAAAATAASASAASTASTAAATSTVGVGSTVASEKSSKTTVKQFQYVRLELPKDDRKVTQSDIVTPSSDVTSPSDMTSRIDVMSQNDVSTSRLDTKVTSQDATLRAQRQVGVTSQDAVVTSQEVVLTSVSAGLRHSAAVTSDGRLFVWGDNSRGQLGISGERVVRTPRPLPTPDDVTVCDVSCGQRHTMLLCRPTAGPDGTEKRHLYGMGDNRRGQVIGPIIPRPDDSPLVEAGRDVTPARLDGPSLVHLPDDVIPARVLCGWTHTIVHCADGRLLGWGRTDYGQLNLPRCSVSSVACGSEHCLAMTSHERCMGMTSHQGSHGMTTHAQRGLDMTSHQRCLAWGWDEHGAAAGTLLNMTSSEVGGVVTSLDAEVNVMSLETKSDVTSSKAVYGMTSSETMDGVTSQGDGNVTSPAFGDGVADVTPKMDGVVVAVGAGYGCSFAVCLVEEAQ